MRRIEKAAIVSALGEHSQSFHVDSRLRGTITATISDEAFYLIRLEDKSAFLSLIWHWNPSSSLLTPYGSSRTLYDVAKRMIDNDWSLQCLYRNEVLEEGQHDPQWFDACRPIAESFNYDHFSWIFVNHPTDHERADSPGGSFYIFDGCHKTLVLAYGIMTGAIEYQPVEAILLIPRRE